MKKFSTRLPYTFLQKKGKTKKKGFFFFLGDPQAVLPALFLSET